MLRCIKTPEKKILKKRIVKFSKGINVSNQRVMGAVTISNIRFYNGGYLEVEIVFEGKVHVTLGGKRDWYGSEILSKFNVSKIKLNRYIRRSVLEEVKRRLNYFGQDLHYCNYIKKLKWL